MSGVVFETFHEPSAPHFRGLMNAAGDIWRLFSSVCFGSRCVPTCASVVGVALIKWSVDVLPGGERGTLLSVC